jgi:hypothetical protein
MPIEIKELHIKGVLANDQNPVVNQPASESDHRAIIDACVEKVLRILEDKKER